MKSISGKFFHWLVPGFMILLCLAFSCKKGNLKKMTGEGHPISENTSDDEIQPDYALLVVPGIPRPGEPFRIVATGGKNIIKAKIFVTGPSGNPEPVKGKAVKKFSFWRMDSFPGCPEGSYTVTISEERKQVCSREFTISAENTIDYSKREGPFLKGWESGTESLYAAWIHALFLGCDERSGWAALHEVIQNRDRNFLYNYLSLDEDNPDSKTRLIMQPDCADNPFFFRAYFAWKLNLPFGYHISDRGSLDRPPRTGPWINPGLPSGINPVPSFNSFLRRLKNGIHSGTARTSFMDDDSDYYPVALDKGSLRPGTVFADPYGHTLIITSWVPQTRKQPGMLLAVDAQPDGSVGIKRFWKGNFLFNTSGVVGEPGFKAFRPVVAQEGILRSLKNEELTKNSGYIPFSLQQRKMESENFYHTMERLINPKPLNPGDNLQNLIKALHEQLKVRVTSVANGEAYFKKHPGAVILMPSRSAAIFQSGGLWEDFSTPNRDLRLLIAMDAVTDFPEKIVRSPEDFIFSRLSSPEKVRKKLHSILDHKTAKLTITYIRTDGSEQVLTVAELLKRKEAFEMAYNPNDGIEIRWGAPEGSSERSTCRRHAPPGQLKTMQSVREWFRKRLHPPT